MALITPFGCRQGLEEMLRQEAKLGNALACADLLAGEIFDVRARPKRWRNPAHSTYTPYIWLRIAEPQLIVPRFSR